MKTVFLFLLVVSFSCSDGQVQRNLKIVGVTVFGNKNYANITYNIKTKDSGDSLDIFVTLFQDLPDNKLKVRLACFKVSNGVMEPFILDQRIDFCKFLKSRNGNPFLLTIYNLVKRLGRVPQSCPIKKGNYYVANLVFNKNTYPAIVSRHISWVLDLEMAGKTVYNITITIQTGR